MNSFVEFEENAQLAEVLDRVERGEQVTVLRHGQKVAMISPAPGRLTAEEVAKGTAAMQRILARREVLRSAGNGMSLAEIIEEKNAGRS